MKPLQKRGRAASGLHLLKMSVQACRCQPLQREALLQGPAIGSDPEAYMSTGRLVCTCSRWLCRPAEVSLSRVNSS